jgi:hypothetical protein
MTYSSVTLRVLIFKKVLIKTISQIFISDTVGSDEGVILLAKWLLIRGRDTIHDKSRSCAGG